MDCGRRRGAVRPELPKSDPGFGGAGFSGGAGAVHDRNRQIGRRGAARRVVPRKRGHLHQRRAPHPARQPRGGTHRRLQTRRPDPCGNDEPLRLPAGALHGQRDAGRNFGHRALLRRCALGRTRHPGQTMARGARRPGHQNPAHRHLQTRQRKICLPRFRGNARTRPHRRIPLHHHDQPRAGTLQQRHHDPPHRQRAHRHRRPAAHQPRRRPRQRHRRGRYGAPDLPARRSAQQSAHHRRSKAWHPEHDVPLSGAAGE